MSDADPERKKARGFVPDLVADAVTDIDFKALHQRGIRCLVLDVDHTLAHYHAMVLDEHVRDFLLEQKKSGYIESIFIASNSHRDLSAIASAVEADVIRPWLFIRKPSRAYFRRVMRAHAFEPSEVAMVGDKLINDIWGGNRAGFYTILVNPIGPDMIFDRIVRRRFWKKIYLKRRMRS